MKKIIRIFYIFILATLFTSCSNKAAEELSDLIVTPELASPILEGTWQVTKVEQITNINNMNPPKVGDRLYIDKDLVAINKEYAQPPQFTSKYVNLNDYLINRGYNLENLDLKEDVVVVNASEGQFLSRDFIKRSDEEIFYIADDNLIYLTKLSDSVDTEIINSYKKLAKKERSLDNKELKDEEDISLLLGVRERLDLENKQTDYKYYTYLIKIPSQGAIKYQKSPDIFLRGKDEFWKVRTNKNTISGLYDNIQAFPVRLEDQIQEQANLDRYSFKHFDMNIKLNFVDKNYISFSYQRVLFDNTINKYGFVATNELEDNRLISIDEFTGENNATEQFKYMVVNEASSVDSELDTEDLEIDNTNFGLVRDVGYWSIETSIYTENDQIKASSEIPMRTYNNFGNQNEYGITRDQVRNINSQFKDYHILTNGNYILIQSADEILLHRINNGHIEKQPLFSIPTPYSTAFISIDQQSGSNAKTLNQAFVNNNEIIDQN